jgi:hypothetical protein
VGDAVARPIAVQVPVRYRFWGSSYELVSTFPLAAGERAIVEGSIRIHTGPFIRRPGDLRLSNQRMVVVSHYALQPDRGFEFPLGSMSRVDQTDSLLTLSYWTALGERTMVLEEGLLLANFLSEWGPAAPAGL